MPAGRRRANTWSATACGPRDRHGCRPSSWSWWRTSRTGSPRGFSIRITSRPSCFHSLVAAVPPSASPAAAAAAGCLDCSGGGGAREQWESWVAKMAAGAAAAAAAARAAPPAACVAAGARTGVWRGFRAAAAAGAAATPGAWQSASASEPVGSHSRLQHIIRAAQQNSSKSDEDDDWQGHMQLLQCKACPACPTYLPESSSLHVSSGAAAALLFPCLWGITWMQQARRMCVPVGLLHNEGQPGRG